MIKYFKLPQGYWVSEENYHKYGDDLTKCPVSSPHRLITKEEAFFGQILPDGSFEDRDDILTIPIDKGDITLI